MAHTWRDLARPVVAKVIESYEGDDEKELRRLISKAYPFGLRRMHPYKVWLDEVKKQVERWKEVKGLAPPVDGPNLFNQ